ncbi:hypothetical protein D9M69_707190 [compost metagenome]
MAVRGGPQRQAAERGQRKRPFPDVAVLLVVFAPGPGQRHQKAESERQQDARKHIQDRQQGVHGAIYLRQKPGVNSTRNDNISSRPSSMAAVHTQV